MYWLVINGILDDAKFEARCESAENIVMGLSSWVLGPKSDVTAHTFKTKSLASKRALKRVNDCSV